MGQPAYQRKPKGKLQLPADKDQKPRASQRKTIVGIFGQTPIEPPENGFNPLLVAWVVDRYRWNGVRDVVRQSRAAKRAQLDRYSQQLFDSCFKNW